MSSWSVPEYLQIIRDHGPTDNPWQQALQPLRSEMSVEQTLLVVETLQSSSSTQRFQILVGSMSLSRIRRC